MVIPRWADRCCEIVPVANLGGGHIRATNASLGLTLDVQAECLEERAMLDGDPYGSDGSMPDSGSGYGSGSGSGSSSGSYDNSESGSGYGRGSGSGSSSESPEDAIILLVMLVWNWPINHIFPGST